ncbi:hypothetical protein L4D17_04780 [Vibrio splendidus]|uniref:hypothetical protein n=1 Tax=Vibrio splendidus TaxID=29497 RepID=UPI003D0BD2A7
MAELLAKHWIISIGFTIFLGALGSALWEAALKPICKKCGSFTFKVLSFNAQKAKDKVYKNAAMGHHELPSLFNLMLTIFMISLILAAPVPLALGKASQIEKDLKATQVSESIIDETQSEKAILESKMEEIESDYFIEKTYLLLFLVLFITINFLYQFLSMNRTNLVVTYFSQAIKCIRPKINENELHVYEQKFASMTSKAEFDSLVEELKQVASENNISLPGEYYL